MEETTNQLQKPTKPVVQVAKPKETKGQCKPINQFIQSQSRSFSQRPKEIMQIIKLHKHQSHTIHRPQRSNE